MSICNKEFDSAVEQIRNGITLQRLIENDKVLSAYFTKDHYKLGNTFISYQLGSKLKTSGLLKEGERKLVTVGNKKKEYWQIVYILL